jgi:hypothetical protein
MSDDRYQGNPLTITQWLERQPTHLRVQIATEAVVNGRALLQTARALDMRVDPQLEDHGVFPVSALPRGWRERPRDDRRQILDVLLELDRWHVAAGLAAAYDEYAGGVDAWGREPHDFGPQMELVKETRQGSLSNPVYESRRHPRSAEQVKADEAIGERNA